MKFLKKLIFLHSYVIQTLLNIYPFFIINVFYDNQSAIGNEYGHYLYLLAWSASSAIGFYYYSKNIWNFYHIPYSLLLHRLICLCMFISCVIPYNSDNFFVINDLHIWIAILSVFLFILEWLKALTTDIYFVNSEFKKNLHIIIVLFSICAVILFSLGHVTSIAEITFSWIINLYLAIWTIKKESV